MRGLTLADPGFVAATAGFSPLDLSPALWLDASDASTITASGSPAKVSQWNDLSGNSRHLAQPVSTWQPTTGADTINGKNVLTFAGLQNVFLKNIALGKAVSGLTVYCVRRHLSFDANEMNVAVLQFNDNGLTLALLGSNFSANKNQLGGRTVTTDTFQRLQSTSDASSTAAEIQTGWWDYANTDATLYVNGQLKASTTSWQSATATSNVNTRIFVGDVSDGADRGINGYIAELIVYEAAHDATNRANVWEYLNAKWAVY